MTALLSGNGVAVTALLSGNGVAVTTPPSRVALHQALHTDLAPLETVCTHYRQAYGDAMIATQRRLIGALFRSLHELLERNTNKGRTILALAEQIVMIRWELHLLRGWRRSMAAQLSGA